MSDLMLKCKGVHEVNGVAVRSTSDVRSLSLKVPATGSPVTRKRGAYVVVSLPAQSDGEDYDIVCDSVHIQPHNPSQDDE